MVPAHRTVQITQWLNNLFHPQLIGNRGPVSWPPQYFYSIFNILLYGVYIIILLKVYPFSKVYVYFLEKYTIVIVQQFDFTFLVGKFFILPNSFILYNFRNQPTNFHNRTRLSSY